MEATLLLSKFLGTCLRGDSAKGGEQEALDSVDADELELVVRAGTVGVEASDVQVASDTGDDRFLPPLLSALGLRLDPMSLLENQRRKGPCVQDPLE